MFKSCKDGVHKFEARYDSKLPPIGEISAALAYILEALRNRTYVHDICVKCGLTIKKESL